ncbi:MGMT family protein [Candidatus Woesearchaeota archaeon]|nr:MGMT family protein [Candidatus Woesearchaeota archaeon]
MSSFSKRVYELCLLVPRGKVTTYKAIAEKLGTKSYRAVGQALRCNPFAPRVPCHRVVRSDGALGGFMGWKKGGKVEEKRKMLETEGVVIVDGKIDLTHYFFQFK